MPYFIYRIGRLNTLEKQRVAESYREAKAAVDALRQQIDPSSGDKVRMIFAASELQAEEQLSRPAAYPDSAVIGDD
jgi:hypothetical protein